MRRSVYRGIFLPLRPRLAGPGLCAALISLCFLLPLLTLFGFFLSMATRPYEIVPFVQYGGPFSPFTAPLNFVLPFLE